MLKTARKQGGRHQQHRRQRDLGEDQRRANTVAADARTAFALLERVAYVTARGLERRSEAEEQAGAEGHQEREDGDTEVDADLGHTREIPRSGRDERLNQGTGDEQAQRSGDGAEDGGLAEQLPDDANARSAERRAERDLAPTRRAADEEETGNVGAGHEQDEHDGSEEHPQHGRGPTAHLIVQRYDADRGVCAVRLGVLIAQPPADRREVVGRLRGGHSRLQPRDHPQESLCAVAATHVRRRRIRDYELGIADKGHEIRP